jgi:hypothetical protein
MLLVVVGAGCGRIGFDGVQITYRDAVIADGPVGYWRLGDTDAVARDETGTADGAYSGACTGGAAGALAGDPDGAMQFDGVTCQIRLVEQYAFPGTAAYTVELWARLATIGGYQHFVMNESRDAIDPIDGYALLESPSGVYFERVKDFSNQSSGIFAIAPGAFVHLVGVYDGRAMALYVDGELIDTTLDAEPMPAYTASPVIGASSAGIGFVDGVLDEIAIYDHALPADRIAVHHAIGTLGPE